MKIQSGSIQEIVHLNFQGVKTARVEFKKKLFFGA